MIITAPNLPYSRLTPITKQQWPPKPFQSYRNSLDRLRKSRGKNTDEWMSFLRPASGKVGKQKKGGFLSSGVFVAKPRRKPGLIPFGASKTELLSSKLDRPMGSSSEVLSGATAKGKEAMIPSPRRNPPRKARPDRYSTLGQEESGSMSSTLVG
ncbi:hypothetical protein BCV69DRAFT_285045 [Microstroma glucosiphilum]|uniref:Uncharacterized protein n=1 Tax=Pseudomicrostroma glucosiphilum TaxID=1684307 RepID=A0A316U1Q9_9BASI|nr:hypothetical protein BCV69DRAFT_285045 [Pseudomicrostroma glucosiphilum]PWN18421.1 hypothetical protein BCV69DRAFT_285045 [Pseudomicrostroma glucosiphilum]